MKSIIAEAVQHALGQLPDLGEAIGHVVQDETSAVTKLRIHLFPAKSGELSLVPGAGGAAPTPWATGTS